MKALMVGAHVLAESSIAGLHRRVKELSEHLPLVAIHHLGLPRHVVARALRTTLHYFLRVAVRYARGLVLRAVKLDEHDG